MPAHLPPLRHSEPIASTVSEAGNSRPVCILDSALAGRFAGFSTIHHELLTAQEMVARACAENDRLIVSALWRTSVAMYARCFAETGRGMPKLEVDDHLLGASSDQLELHRTLLDIRHNFLSHAGSSEVWRQSAQVMLQDPAIGRGVYAVFAGQTVRSVPPPEELTALSALFAIVAGNVQTSMTKAYERLKAEVAEMNLEDLYARATGA